MADKYLEHDGQGGAREVEAVATGGSASVGKIPALNAAGQIDETMLPSALARSNYTIAASEALAAGDFVNVYNDSGTPKVRKADASSNKPAHGFVKAAVSAGADAVAYTEGQNTAVSGATAGVVFLSTTAGGFTSTAPTASGNIVQKIGTAFAGNMIDFEKGQVIILA